MDHHIIEGNPANESDWEPVTAYLQSRFKQLWNGSSMGITATNVDSGDQTQAVYNWVTKAQNVIPNLRAIKGRPGIALVGPVTLQEVNYRGRKIARGVKLWNVGVDNAKDLLLGQLAIKEPGPGYLHFSHELPREWFEQLTAEHRVLQRINGKDVFRWMKRRQRNEILDCRNYALHAAMAQGLHKWSDAKWQLLEQAVQPPRDLFSPPETDASDAAPVLEEPVPRVTTPTVPPKPAAHRRPRSSFASEEWSSRL